MGAERERAYNAVGGQPAQNLDVGFRSRWAVNATGLGRRDKRDQPRRPPSTASAGRTSGEITVDLTPLMRLAQEACWNRLLNRPRPCQAEI
jgi:hypothetical protein